MNSVRLPAEWEAQSGVMLTWPHADTDWAYILPDVERVYVNMAREILKREPLVIVTPNPEHVASLCPEATTLPCPTNDTWARDHAFITTIGAGKQPFLNDFTFNGWGMKFAANLDNQINSRIFPSGVFNGEYVSQLDFVLEGGSIESDGKGTFLVTSECLLSRNRNEYMSRERIAEELKCRLGAERIMWLDHGYLAGDDTDSHIDTLARLCPNDVIAYVQCLDEADEHYKALHAMEEQLSTFLTSDGKPYSLLPLPMPTPIYDADNEEERLPATYANFLIINGAVLMPTYNQPTSDALAARQLQKAFPDREIVPIDCLPLIRQHGSLHCCTMQFPEDVIIYKHQNQSLTPRCL
ncbi:MAG: agmatine deiminase family protein [Bacteroidaceae bacterium]|nr:agmatine deiminase family protein [Bacteroidaceae bacterium]